MQINVMHFLRLFCNKETTIANYNIASSNSEELLGVVIDSKVTFANILKTSVERLIKTSMHWREYATLWLNYKHRLITKTFFSNLIIVLLYGCVIAENLITKVIDYKKELYALSIMINDKIFISCLRKANKWKSLESSLSLASYYDRNFQI